MNAIILSVHIDGDLTDEEAEALLCNMCSTFSGAIAGRVFDTTYRREETE